MFFVTSVYIASSNVEIVDGLEYEHVMLHDTNIDYTTTKHEMWMSCCHRAVEVWIVTWCCLRKNKWNPQ